MEEVLGQAHTAGGVVRVRGGRSLRRVDPAAPLRGDASGPCALVRSSAWSRVGEGCAIYNTQRGHLGGLHAPGLHALMLLLKTGPGSAQGSLEEQNS